MKRGTNWLEWTVLAVGGALTAVVVGVLLWEAFGPARTPPAVAVEVGAAQRRGAGWEVPVVVRNRGAETAIDVRIEVTTSGPEGVERGELEIAFLPGGARREGWVSVSGPSLRSRGRVLGYTVP